MTSAVISSDAAIAAPSKDHFKILDGLRGVAAIMVILLHWSAPFSFGDPHSAIINHGYLAVDFFFADGP